MEKKELVCDYCDEPLRSNARFIIYKDEYFCDTDCLGCRVFEEAFKEEEAEWNLAD